MLGTVLFGPWSILEGSVLQLENKYGNNCYVFYTLRRAKIEKATI